GVGSGVISIELAKRFPQLNFHAWDISDIAIKVTKENMALQSVSNIQLSHGDFFDLFHSKVTESPIILISNPPYISALDYENLSTQVLKEPKEALLAEDYGLRVIDQLIQVAKNYNFILLSEIGYDQKQRLERAWIDLPLQFKLDFAGKYRYLIYFSDNHAQQYNL
ncbi:MAG: methyltransferase, partial [Candidatus Margulisiibacteriota bacterium]